MVVPQKSKNKITTLPNNSTSRYIPKRNERRISTKYLHTHVHSTSVHNSQKVETTQMSKCPLTDQWQNKMWYYTHC